MGLVEALDAVHNQLDAIRADAGMAIPSRGFGERDLSKQSSPPRVVFVPRGGGVRPARGSGGDGRRNPNPLWTRLPQVEAHVWGEDEQSAEVLANQVVQALDVPTLSHGAYKMLGEQWATNSITNNGILLVLTFSVEIPWTEAPRAVAVPTSAGESFHVVHSVTS